MAEERIFIKIIREICEEKGIDFKIMSYNWIIELKKGDKIRHIAGNWFDLNPEATGHIACDKYATYSVLSSNGVPCVKHQMVFNPALRSAYIPDNGIYVDVIKFFLEHGKVVVKPNDGSQGMNVFCCSTIKEVETAIQKIFRTQPSLSICPFYQIDTEYRTFVLNGEVKLIYGKTKPEVVGDGVSTLGQLVEKLNLPQKSVAEENVRALDLSYVPAEGERVQISWKFNLSGGATPKVLEKGELYSRVEELALKAAHAANAKFATIDVIQDTDGNLWVLEINSGVCGTIFIDHIEGGYEIIKSIYSEAIDEMFK